MMKTFTQEDIELQTPKTLPGTPCEKLFIHPLAGGWKSQNSINKGQVNHHRVLVQRKLYLTMRTDNAQRT